MIIINAKLPTKYGLSTIYWFSEKEKEHCYLVFWDLWNKENILCRIHSSCITGDIFHSTKCDCGDQLDYALQAISKEWGILIYLNQEWRDIGLVNKIRAYALQDQWYDTIEANEKLNLPVDNRNYKIVKEILNELQIKSIRLMTNNPDKIEQLQKLWIIITWRIPIIADINIHSEKYLKTKKEKMNHYL